MTPRYAPVAIFAFNRPDHIRQLLESLLSTEPGRASSLFVFCDGPRDPTDIESVQATRSAIHQTLGRNASIIESPTNRGLATSIISGVSELVEKFGQVIVLEDDLVLHPDCIAFLNAALVRYANEERVFHINAYRYPVPSATRPSFLHLTSSWGWATWKRAWRFFEADSTTLIRQLKDRRLVRKFDFDGEYHYFKMLNFQAARKIDSWAIRWYASTILQNSFALYPSTSMVANSGFDNSGTHCGITSAFDVTLQEDSRAEWPDTVEEDVVLYSQMRDFFRKIRVPLPDRILQRLKRSLGRS